MRTRIPRVGLVRLFAGLSMTIAVILSAAGTSAQTSVPYFGKNQIRYDNFEWHIYTTDHFEIYYYPEIEQHLERMAGYAESAYQQVSADLKHDLAVQGAADPLQDAQRVRAAERRSRARRRKASARSPSRTRNRMRAADRRAAGPALRPDRPRAHALSSSSTSSRTSLIRRSVPLWVNEGLSDYETRPLEAARPDDGARRRGRRHRPEDDARSKATAASATRA